MIAVHRDVELSDLGYGPFFSTQIDRLDRPDLVPARIAADGPGIYPLLGCRAPLGELSGRLRHELHETARPAAGDWVAVADNEDRAIIQHVLRRRTAMVRRAADSESTAQTIAANVDVLCLVSSANRDLNLRRIERYLTAVWDSGATPVIVLNKVDLVADVAPMIESITSVALAVPIVQVSALTGLGIDALRDRVGQGTTVGLVGSSGVGKSSLINRLVGREVQHVRDIREDDARGRHTTTRRELVLLSGGGVLIDTPGMRELGLIEDEGGVDAAFADIAGIAQHCRFNDCRHESEPGCAVQEALFAGALSAERLQSYRKLQREIAAVDRKRDPVLAANERRRWKTITKEMRAKDKVTRKWS
ncbi:MAG: ribosome small subunit-dependent GTPase A [Chloroflexota bacterium]|nr:ribosome small subunit-dependent GTPase A [Chloroflexota bacterium]